MSMWETALHSLAAYPRWFVFICVAITAAVGVWVLAKVLKWTLYLALMVAFACVVGGMFLWFWG